MRLRLIYRCYGGENRKNRPEYYSKALALASFLRAAAQVDADLVFLNDGPIPEPMLGLMRASGGLIVQMPDGPQGMRASYRRALQLHDELDWPDEDLVWLSEDDYLYREDAFVRLLEAGEAFGGPYLALAGVQGRADVAEERVRMQLPHAWRAAADHTVNGQRWMNIAGVTSTFGARVGVLRQDRTIFLQCMQPFRNRFLDHETCLIYQGVAPYRGLEFLTGLPGDFRPGLRGVVRAGVLFPFRLAIAARARSRRDRPHLLYALEPNAAVHLENEHLGDGRAWAAVAADVRAWAEEQSLRLR